MATLRDLLAAGMTEEEIAQYMAAEKAQPTLGALVQSPVYAEDVTSAAELAPNQIAPSTDYTPGTVTKLAPTTSDAERLQRDTEFRNAANARRKELEQQNVPATTMEGMLNQIMKMAQKGYVTKSNDPAYSAVEYRNGMPIEQIMQTPQFKMLQALSPQFKQAAEIDKMKAEAEKERALVSGGLKRPQTPEEKAREEALKASALAATPGTAENDRLRKGEQLAQKGAAAWESSLNDATKLKSFLNQAIKDTDWTSAGLIGQALSAVGGTSAADLESTLDTIKAKIGFNELQQMRKESPTGGALGQVAVRELEFLQAVEGSLKQKQTPAQLRKNLGLILESTARLEEDLRKNPPDWTGQKVRTPNQMQPAARPTGAPIPFRSEAEANAAGLPPGTLVIINGRRAVVE